MHVVNFRCPRCAVEQTVLRSDGSLLCINCLLRRQPATLDPPAALRTSRRRASAPTSAA
jgi:hypothetical protein